MAILLAWDSASWVTPRDAACLLYCCPPLADSPAADDCGDTPQSRRLACPLGRHNDDWEMGVMHDLGAGRAQGEAPPYARAAAADHEEAGVVAGIQQDL